MSKGEFVKKNAPEFCDVTLVYDDNQALNDSKVSCLHCMCFSGTIPTYSSITCENFSLQNIYNYVMLTCVSGSLGQVSD